MEPDKSLNEALFRSHSATEKANQSQHQLYNMSAPAEEKQGAAHATPPQAELNESPRNLIQSWQTLRKLDEELADKKAGEAARRDKPNNNSTTK